jgi:hypothetical protein
MTTVARTWSGRVPRRHADAFEDHLHATGIAEAAQIGGHLGAQILRRHLGTDVEFTLVTYCTYDEHDR